MSIAEERYLFTVKDFERMYRSGLFDEDARIELLDGEIIEMSPIGPTHEMIVSRLNDILVPRLTKKFIVRVQSSLQLNARSLPQPDISIANYREDFYSNRHPTAKDVPLLVEVAHSSLEYDRRRKLPRYAKAKVAEVWIVDVEQRRIEQYSEPRGERYGRLKEFGRSEKIKSVTIPALVLPTNDILG